jgi:O-antigen ligase
MAFGIMLGAVPTSVPQFILLINWLLEAGFSNKWQLLKRNKIFWSLELIFLIHVFGLLYTEDIAAGIKDLQIKLPLFILPLVFFSSAPLDERENRFVLLAFLTGCLVNTSWCLLYSFVLHTGEHLRNNSRFMSHIRLGLYLNMAIAVCYFLYRNTRERIQRMAYVVLALFYVIVIIVLGLASGLVIMGIIAGVAGLYSIIKMTWPFKLLVLLIMGVVFFSAFIYVKTIYREQTDPAKSGINRPIKKNAKGELYVQFDSLGKKENGYYIHINIHLSELKRGWNARCPSDTFSFEPELYNVKRYELLLRYMASKGLLKDSTGIAALSDEDIQNIHNNISNYRYKDWSFLHQRVYELVNEYDDFITGRNLNGNSVTMRYYFWKAALFAIHDKPVFGVGTGDVQNQMNKSYALSDSPLHKNYWKRPHNQFLTITVAFGLCGLAFFLITLFYPFTKLYRKLNVLYMCFIVVYISSFMTEDTIETQAGVTFFAFFNTYLLSWAFFRKPQNPEDSQQSH